MFALLVSPAMVMSEHMLVSGLTVIFFCAVAVLRKMQNMPSTIRIVIRF